MGLEAAVRTTFQRARATALTWAGLLAVAVGAVIVTGQLWRAVIAVAAGVPLVALSLVSLRALVGVMARRSVSRTAATAAAGAAAVAGWVVAVLAAALATVVVHVLDVVGGYGLVELVPVLALSVLTLLLHAFGRRIVHGETWVSLGLGLVLVLVVLLPAAVARPTVLALPAVAGGLLVLFQAQVWVPIAIDGAFPDEHGTV